MVDTPAVKNGKDFIYNLWKSLLNRWLSRPGCAVFLATPFLDVERLDDICKLVIKHQGSADIKAFYVRERCYFDSTITDLVDKSKFRANETIKSKVFNSLKIDPGKNFHCKFICCTYAKGNARVLVTSANFTGHHFDHDNMETVGYHKTEADAIQRLIKPLDALELNSLVKG